MKIRMLIRPLQQSYLKNEKLNNFPNVECNNTDHVADALVTLKVVLSPPFFTHIHTHIYTHTPEGMNVVACWTHAPRSLVLRRHPWKTLSCAWAFIFDDTKTTNNLKKNLITSIEGNWHGQPIISRSPFSRKVNGIKPYWPANMLFDGFWTSIFGLEGLGSCFSLWDLYHPQRCPSSLCLSCLQLVLRVQL